MIKILQIISFFIIAGLISSCSQILQSVDLDITTDDVLVQETFEVIEKTLTINEARKQQNAPYFRTVLRNGRGENAKPIPEKLALKSEFPKSEPPVGYKIGIGDAITFSRLIENNRVTRQIANEWPIQQIASNYKLGIGDTVALTLMKEDNASNQMAPVGRGNSNGDNDYQTSLLIHNKAESTPFTTGRIGSDGSVLC